MPTLEERALALVNEVMDQAKRGSFPCRLLPDADAIVLAEALCRALEAHDATLAEFEAFKREVSDSVEHYLDQWRNSIPSREVFACQFGSFILPKPVDPLVECFSEALTGTAANAASYRDEAQDFRAALAKRGIKLVEVGDAD